MIKYIITIPFVIFAIWLLYYMPFVFKEMGKEIKELKQKLKELNER